MMGQLLYADAHAFTFDDRSLNHLRTVITTKLLRKESFPFTWTCGKHQRTLWMHPAVSIVFEFDSELTEAINPEWIAVLTEEANAPTGLRLVAEPSQ